jgi:hypothetical protein
MIKDDGKYFGVKPIEMHNVIQINRNLEIFLVTDGW